jgi:hypothetical protein
MCLVSCVLIFALTVFALRHTCHSKECYNVPKQGELSHYRYLALSCETDDEDFESVCARDFSTQCPDRSWGSQSLLLI